MARSGPMSVPDDRPEPWYHAGWRVVVALAAVALLGFGLGLFAGSRDDVPGADSVDVVFLQEMRRHHDQATEMAVLLLDRPDADPMLRLIAVEILAGQQLESGLMIQLLRSWGHAEQTDDDDASLMPGMATEEEMDALRTATGVEGDRLFITLMSAHHRGGIDMARDAVERAERREVRRLAQGMIDGQTADLVELNGVMERL